MMLPSRLKGKSDIPPEEVGRFKQEMAWENIQGEMLVSAMLFCSYILTFAWVVYNEDVVSSFPDRLPWHNATWTFILILLPPVVTIALSSYARRQKQSTTTLVIHRINVVLLIFGSCLPSILVHDHLYYEMVILLVSALVPQVPVVSFFIYSSAMGLLLLGMGWTGELHDFVHLEVSDLVITTVLGLMMVQFRFSDRIRNYLVTTSLEAQHAQLREVNRELVNANTYLKNLSRLDGLTGVNNRRAFDEMLDREWRRAMRTGGTVGLLMIDIDFFKSFNDTYGHQAGDECLRRVAEALRTGARRGGDMVSRYGGEEFAVLLPCESEASLTATAEVLRQKVADLGISHGTPEWGHLSISLGGALMVPQPEEEADILVAQADGALYAAKGGGRNRVVVRGELGMGAA
ncbi:hypothetical protein DSLASN_45850 [Desulfoluna limicola]|uniref:diguanylate cyclase n=1 Tax=Desulfoluna limicola TaxID=2810562 RepID=A0ABM7PPC9_9BACT|nr:GGDEF domain-containing protein [Desulfoluna limicola]BCS98953.1 hypothetical protein DSLASN_45850 [Desulfoluna limicola]